MTQAAFSIPELEKRLSDLLESQDDVASALHWILFRYQKNTDIHILNFYGDGDGDGKYEKTSFIDWMNEVYGIEITSFPGEDVVPVRGIVIVDKTSTPTSEDMGSLLFLQKQGIKTLFIAFSQQRFSHAFITNLKCKETKQSGRPVMLSQ